MLGRSLNFCNKFCCKYPLGAMKWVADKTIAPSFNYIGGKINDRFKKTSIYEAYCKGEDSNSVARMKS